jgi:hypothetical protein
MSDMVIRVIVTCKGTRVNFSANKYRGAVAFPRGFVIQ